MGAAGTLLVELLTEELPPKALPRLAAAFAEGIAGGLRKRALADDTATVTAFATPRRLAVSIDGVREASPSRTVETKLMPASVAFSADGRVCPSSVASNQSAGAGSVCGTPMAGVPPVRGGAVEGGATALTTPWRETTKVWPHEVHCTDAPASVTLRSSSSYSVWQRSQRTSIYRPMGQQQ